MTISQQRLRELERAELKLQALENGGVDAWEWYDESLKPYYKEVELEEKLDAVASEIEEALGEMAYEPSDRGAGVAFRDDAAGEIIKILSSYNVSFGEDEVTG